jgi:diaminohydroxyphosphoribosylaminopyrimidine deaminase/5-amino-6-(5-phosphoribosylamino)uracil reductase
MNFSEADHLYMKRALQLAALGCEWVSPNPMVGCVIVCDDLIIGEGFHQKYGEAHAEVNAIKSVTDPSLLPNATMYVTLEPCTHFGKTPPCVDLLIQHKVKKVIICNKDPFPDVAGKGIEKLKASGIDVKQGLLESEGLFLNRRFFKAHTKGLPYITIKWAETADGFVALPDRKPLGISNTTTNISVHRWRAEEEGIMVGTTTIKTDNPKLNARLWPEGKNPTRIIIDKELKLESNFNIFDQSQKTLIYNFHQSEKLQNLEFIKISYECFLINILKDLKLRGVNSILVEGGPQLIQSFFEENLYDEIRLIKSDLVLKEGIAAPKVPSGIPLIETQKILNDQMFFFRR